MVASFEPITFQLLLLRLPLNHCHTYIHEASFDNLNTNKTQSLLNKMVQTLLFSFCFIKCYILCCFALLYKMIHTFLHTHAFTIFSKQNQNTKYGTFYEAKRKSTIWSIDLWSKTKKQKMDHFMKQTSCFGFASGGLARAAKRVYRDRGGCPRSGRLWLIWVQTNTKQYTTYKPKTGLSLPKERTITCQDQSFTVA